MIKAMRTAASGMSAQQMNVDNIANNLANVNTTGFKRSKVEFQDVLYQRIQKAGVSTATGAVIPTNVEVGYFSQHAMELLDPERTVLETVQDIMPLAPQGVLRKLCAAFLFQGDEVDKRVRYLSGGEKTRVVLATLLVRPLNLLVLDEPTNHLDIQSRAILLDALRRYSGTLMLVSHDRYFLRALVNRVFEIDRGQMRIYEGNYDYYLSKRA